MPEVDKILWDWNGKGKVIWPATTVAESKMLNGQHALA
jgi:hypothetical protein